MEELYKQEIAELTDLLRNSEEWNALRSALINKGFDIDQLFLVSFTEDEEENEYGVILTKQLDIYEYSVSDKKDNDSYSLNMKKITNGSENYPQIPVAVNMINRGEI